MMYTSDAFMQPQEEVINYMYKECITCTSSYIRNHLNSSLWIWNETEPGSVRQDGNSSVFGWSVQNLSQLFLQNIKKLIEQKRKSLQKYQSCRYSNLRREFEASFSGPSPTHVNLSRPFTSSAKTRRGQEWEHLRPAPACWGGTRGYISTSIVNKVFPIKN